MIIGEKDCIWSVYIHISPSNKHYVGITSQKPEKRWRNGRGYKYNTYFTNAINKYGWNNFQHEVIASNLTEDEAKNFEKILIRELKSNNEEYGYNLTEGGDGTCGVRRYGEDNHFYGKHHSDETKKIMKENHPHLSGEDNHFYGKHHSDEVRQKMSRIAKQRFQDGDKINRPMISEERKMQIGKEHSKQIIQYDLNMNIISVHDSLLSLEKLGYRRASIRAVCLGKRETYAGYIWKYQSDLDAWKDGYIVGTKSDNIYCLDKEFNIVGIYKSYSEASKDTGVNRRIISKACKSDDHYSFGYYWLFKNDYEKEVA